MHPGVWIGKKFNDAEKKVLILGESHYGNRDEIGKVTYMTKEIVQKYVGEKRHIFFDNIAKSFGYESDDICEFYEQVCFGNYVNVVVDKDGKQNGKFFIEKNSDTYNKELIDFCVSNSIDIVVCFSMKSYWNLPSGGESKGEVSIKRKNSDSKIITRKWLYKKGTLRNDSRILDKDLLVYGLYHPSDRRRYDPQLEYEEYISKQPELAWLCNKSESI